MQRVPQELVDRFIDESKDDIKLLRICSLISRRWVHRSRKHLFQRIAFSSCGVFGSYCDQFPSIHGVHAYVRELVISQQDFNPWLDMEFLYYRLGHLQAFCALETLILIGIHNGSMRGPDAICTLATAFGEVPPPIRNIQLINWKISPTALVDFICLFPSLDSVMVKDVDFLVGLPGWSLPSVSPHFAGRFELNHHRGRGPAVKFLRLLSRLPLSFREVSLVDTQFPGTLDPIISILEKCSRVLVKIDISYGYQPGTTVVFPSFRMELRTERSTTAINFLGATIRPIRATFPELREISLKPSQENSTTVDEFALKLLSVISSPHLFHVTLNHAASYNFDKINANKLREADRTIFELAQRTGREVSFDWHFVCDPSDVKSAILPYLRRVEGLGTLNIARWSG